MERSDLGLSNIYLKIGSTLIMAGLAAIAMTSFFSTDRELHSMVRNLGGLSLLTGAVVYVVGRVVQAKRPREQA